MVAVAALILVIEPLVSGRRPESAQPSPADEPVDPEESESPKVRALIALREVEFDRATGKLSEADYAGLRARFEAEALAAIREERAASGDSMGSARTDLDALAEDAIRQARRQAGRCPACGGTPLAGAVYCSWCGCALSAGAPRPRCGACGGDMAPDDQFCPDCGAESVLARRAS